MSDARASGIDPRVLGLRIQEARKARGLTQQDAANVLGVSRPTYIAIEKGQQIPSAGELICLAELYGRSVHELMRRREPVRDFSTQFRAAAVRGTTIAEDLETSVTLLQQLCDDYVDLEE
jgi:transcriptional regulator with XRE-family HTH domain